MRQILTTAALMLAGLLAMTTTAQAQVVNKGRPTPPPHDRRDNDRRDHDRRDWDRRDHDRRDWDRRDHDRFDRDFRFRFFNFSFDFGGK